ncbi:MAG: MBL fold metallo-hydrolase [Anaerolineae bacterium]|nr:MBL fold metallo-hydrolase [Anaerolineae bacterium]
MHRPHTHYDLQPLAAGVWAALAQPGGVAHANAGIVDLGAHTLIFDAAPSSEAAGELRTAAETLTGRSVAYLIDSHGHAGHCANDDVFDNDAIVVATDHAGQELLARGCRLSVQTFVGRLTFHGRARRADLIAPGHAHSAGDCYLVLPGDGIGFLGDLASFGCQPALDDTDPEAWSAWLAEWERSGMDVVVPGHGPVGGKAEIAAQRLYLHVLQALVVEALRDGRAPEAALTQRLPAPFDSWSERGLLRKENVRAMARYLSHPS